MKIGIVAYSTDTGLGYQTWDFFRWMEPCKVMLIDLSELNGMAQHPGRFEAPFSQVINVKGFPKSSDIELFLAGLDVVFCAETPLNYELFRVARELGVKTILQYNWELLDYLERPELPQPDLFAAPSLWHIDDLPYKNKAFVPVPIDTDLFTVQGTRPKKRRFLHVQGRPAMEDRNGTEIFLEATAHLEAALPDQYAFNLATQSKDFAERVRIAYPFVQVLESLENRTDMYRSSDILVMPRRFGGLCLPVNEALACGLPVIMPNISPNNKRLPDEWLVEAKRGKNIQTRTTIETYDTDPLTLAEKMIEIASLRNAKREETLIGGVHFDMEQLEARQYAMQYSWRGMKKFYQKVLEDVCRSL